MKKYKPYDVLKAKKINYQELNDDIKCEVAILGGLDIFTDAHVQGVVDITTKICEQMNSHTFMSIVKIHKKSRENICVTYILYIVFFEIAILFS